MLGASQTLCAQDITQAGALDGQGLDPDSLQICQGSQIARPACNLRPLARMRETRPVTFSRPAAVAGRFYCADPTELRDQVGAALAAHRDVVPRRYHAAVGPHAGFMYCAQILAKTYARLELPQTVVLVGPNHTGLGPRCSLWPQGDWQLPGGDVKVDHELATALLSTTMLESDTLAHRQEHALEVHLPFIRQRRADVRIVPISLGHLDLAQCQRLADQITSALKGHDDVMLIASTDMSHFLSADQAQIYDGIACDRIAALDPEGLHTVVEGEHISMCGYVPTTIALMVARARGATTAQQVQYGHSGLASGDHTRVVGYAGFTVG